MTATPRQSSRGKFERPKQPSEAEFTAEIGAEVDPDREPDFRAAGGPDDRRGK